MSTASFRVSAWHIRRINMFTDNMSLFLEAAPCGLSVLQIGLGLSADAVNIKAWYLMPEINLLHCC